MAEFSAEPGLGKAQIVLNDVDGLAEGFRSFFGRHPSEVPHFNQSSQGLVFTTKRVRSGIQVAVYHDLADRFWRDGDGWSISLEIGSQTCSN
jgi:hypothetical protein